MSVKQITKHNIGVSDQQLSSVEENLKFNIKSRTGNVPKTKLFEEPTKVFSPEDLEAPF